jgi:nicotinate phosphoribosyltransferase
MIKSLLDTDLYKYTMMQVVFEKYTSVHVRYDFKCRNANILENLGTQKFEFIVAISTAIHELCKLKITDEELDYLSKIRFFKPNFIEFLRTFQLNESYVRINEENDDLSIIIEGPWISTILFEVPILAIVSESYHRLHDTTATALIAGQEKFADKIKYLDNHIHHDSELRITDLGTRRRFSYKHQLDILRNACHSSYIRATSNVHFAMKLGLTPMGTMAHEYVCAHQQLGRVEDSQKAAFQAWADVYRGDLGIALSDTVGFRAFCKDFDLYFAKLFDGARHDSGCPYNWCEQLCKHYNRLGIDPKTKTAIFSDGLTFELIVDLFKIFQNDIKLGFGIGTNLTNDCGVDPLQIVIKMTECNGRPVAKISDSKGKAMCKDEGFEKYIRGIFDV